MSKLNKNDRASLCLFTFSDGRRCRTPRTGNHPHFCFDHAQKEARVRASETLGKDLAYFFSGDYLSACDLSTALARILPAVVRGDIKPKTARTVAYLAQTLLQSIRLAQHEYIEALSTNGWRNAICNSVNQNHDYLFPPKPAPPQTQAPQPAAAPPPNAPTAAAANVAAAVPPFLRSDPVGPPGPHAQPAPSIPRPAPTPPLPATPPVQTPVNCHSERSEEPAFSPTSAPSPTSLAPAPPIPSTPPPTRLEQARRVNPAPASPPPPRPPDRSAPWWTFDPDAKIPPDSHLL